MVTISGAHVLDAHVRIGESREAALSVEALLTTMNRLGIDTALIAPPERCIAYHNAEGNALTADSAAASGGRLRAYAVANPWRGTDAIADLDRARSAGAVALAVDPVLQGFDLHDGLLDPLLHKASEWRWPVYVRTGTPPTALPLPLASLARRHPNVTFIMGRSGATDFWIDAVPALRYAPNLLADTSYAPWDTVLSGFGADPSVGPGRVVFATDAPYTVPEVELQRILDWPLPAADRARVLGENLAHLLL
jgi:predicted TIM-barrel fold metal-dependent hydrolase